MMSLLLNAKIAARQELQAFARIALDLSESAEDALRVEARLAWLLSRHPLESPADISYVLKDLDGLHSLLLDVQSTVSEDEKQGKDSGALTTKNLQPVREAAEVAIDALCTYIDTLRSAA